MSVQSKMSVESKMSVLSKIFDYFTEIKNDPDKKKRISNMAEEFSNPRSKILPIIKLRMNSSDNIEYDKVKDDVKKLYDQYKRNHLSNSGQFIDKLLKIIEEEKMNDTYMEDVDEEVVADVDEKKQISKTNKINVDKKRKKEISKTNKIIISPNNCNNIIIIN
jgi:hypothetical protein